MKYYTPAEEDIRVGLKCERYYPTGLDILPGGWYEHVISKSDICYLNSTEGNIYNIRVPYLTAEQIEAEGWERCFLDNEFKKTIGPNKTRASEYWMIVFNHLNEIDIKETTNDSHKRLYYGSCRCINDLRLISKLLGI